MDDHLEHLMARLSELIEEVGNPTSQHTSAVRLCSMEDLTPGKARRFEVADHPIVVVRIDDHVYAVEDRCSHQDVALSGGEIDTREASIECPRHGSRFSLVTGEALVLPAIKPVRVYRTAVTEDVVYLEVQA